MSSDFYPPDIDEKKKTDISATDLEAGILGALLNDQENYLLAEGLQSDFFYDKRNKTIYDIFLILYGKGNADMLTVSLKLRDSGLLSEAGGEDYIADICSTQCAPVNLPSYVNILKSLAYRRKMVGALNNCLVLINKPGTLDVSEITDNVETQISEISTSFSDNGDKTALKKIGLAANEVSDAIYKNKGFVPSCGLDIGFPRLNDRLLGLKPSELYIIAGRPGVGKTTFCMNIAQNVAKSGKSVLVFSLEMSAEELTKKIISTYGINMHSAQIKGKYNADELSKLASATADLENLDLFIEDGGSLNILRLRAVARAVIHQLSKQGKELDLIVIDYLQLMHVSHNFKDGRTNEVSIISRSLKQLSKELGLPIVALSQLSRDIDKRIDQTPKLSDLRESGSIEQDSDVIMFLSYNKEGNKSGGTPINLIIAKFRSGPVGKIEMKFNKYHSLFREEALATS